MGKKARRSGRKTVSGSELLQKGHGAAQQAPPKASRNLAPLQRGRRKGGQGEVVGGRDGGDGVAAGKAVFRRGGGLGGGHGGEVGERQRRLAVGGRGAGPHAAVDLQADAEDDDEPEAHRVGNVPRDGGDGARGPGQRMGEAD